MTCRRCGAPFTARSDGSVQGASEAPEESGSDPSTPPWEALAEAAGVSEDEDVEAALQAVPRLSERATETAAAADPTLPRAPELIEGAASDDDEDPARLPPHLTSDLATPPLASMESEAEAVEASMKSEAEALEASVECGPEARTASAEAEPEAGVAGMTFEVEDDPWAEAADDEEGVDEDDDLLPAPKGWDAGPAVAPPSSSDPFSLPSVGIDAALARDPSGLAAEARALVDADSELLVPLDPNAQPVDPAALEPTLAGEPVPAEFAGAVLAPPPPGAPTPAEPAAKAEPGQPREVREAPGPGVFSASAPPGGAPTGDLSHPRLAGLDTPLYETDPPLTRPPTTDLPGLVEAQAPPSPRGSDGASLRPPTPEAAPRASTPPASSKPSVRPRSPPPSKRPRPSAPPSSASAKSSNAVARGLRSPSGSAALLDPDVAPHPDSEVVRLPRRGPTGWVLGAVGLLLCGLGVAVGVGATREPGPSAPPLTDAEAAGPAAPPAAVTETVESEPAKPSSEVAAEGEAEAAMPDPADAFVDAPAPEGSAYLTRSVRLRERVGGRSGSTLEEGTEVRRVSAHQGWVLVFVPPGGPAGFVEADRLSERKPLGVLAAERAFEDCGGPTGPCLSGARRQEERCLEACASARARDERRCVSACRLARERCESSCRR